jgi:hypothetical protein
MRIVQGPDTPAATDLGRVDALEKIVKSILQRLLSLEEKMEVRKKAPNSATPAPETSFSSSTASLDTEVIKKGLLSKMWKYLNDERPPKAA